MDSRMVFHDKKQMEITDKFLVNENEFLQDALSFVRKRIDKIYKNNPVYPEGYCCQTSDYVFKTINLNKDNTKSSFKFFKEIEKKGAIFKRVYGIQHGKYFQNGIQFGDLFLDVSNDTVDVNKDSIEISRLGSSGMENFSTYERYVEIVEKYRGFDVYPNVYFPFISTICPFIFIDKKGNMMFSRNHTSLLVKDVEHHKLQLAEDFLFNSKYSNKKLPEKYIKQLSEKFHFVNGNSQFINNHEMAIEANVFERGKMLFGEDFGSNFVKGNHKNMMKTMNEIREHIKII